MSIKNRALLDGIKLDSIKGILIDIDDTMYSYEPNHLNGLSACYKEISKNDNVSLDLDKFKDIYRDSRNKITVSLSPLSACRSRALAFELLFSKLGFKNAYVHAINYEKIYWDKFLENPEYWQLKYFKKMVVHYKYFGEQNFVYNRLKEFDINQEKSINFDPRWNKLKELKK